jgi:hypothetical protein
MPPCEPFITCLVRPMSEYGARRHRGCSGLRFIGATRFRPPGPPTAAVDFLDRGSHDSDLGPVHLGAEETAKARKSTAENSAVGKRIGKDGKKSEAVRRLLDVQASRGRIFSRSGVKFVSWDQATRVNAGGHHSVTGYSNQSLNFLITVASLKSIVENATAPT